MDNPTGIHRLSEADYHGDTLAPKPSLSSSLAKILLSQSPLHAWTASRRLNPDFEERTSDTFDLGKAAHRAVLGRGADYVAIPDDMLASNGAASTKEAKAFIAEMRESGRTPLKSDVIEQVDHIHAAALRSLNEYGIAIDADRTEIAAIAEINGVWCRAMIDYAPADPRQPLYDFKTCEDASPEACIRAVQNYGYDVQAAHYLDTWFAATGEKRGFRFIFQEKSAPFEVCVVELLSEKGHTADWMEDARGKVASARRIWGECVESNVWPGYPRQVAVVGAPSWHRTRWAESPIWAAADNIRKPSTETMRRVAEWQSPKGLQA